MNIKNHFVDYMVDVKHQLTCNNPEPVDYITYDYTEKQIDDNEEYFKNCLNRSLSGYKALLFFSDYLAGEYRIKSYQMVYNYNPIEDKE